MKTAMLACAAALLLVGTADAGAGKWDRDCGTPLDRLLATDGQLRRQYCAASYLKHAQQTDTLKKKKKKKKKSKFPKPCNVDKLQQGDLCSVDVYEIHPTQFALGMSEIRCKTSRFEDMSSKDLQDYLMKNPVPVVAGPDPYADPDVDKAISLYAYDHHHMCRSLLEADIDSELKYVVVNVTDYLYKPSLNMSAFWKTMVDRRFLWLYDEKGLEPLNPFYLPLSTTRMQNDPYRSLAYLVRHAGGYLKENIPFQDWMWANFFAEKKVLPLPSPGDLREPLWRRMAKQVQTAAAGGGGGGDRPVSWRWCQVAPNDEGDCLMNEDPMLLAHVQAAVNLAKTAEAAVLPGYGKGQLDPPNCGDSDMFSALGQF